MWRPRTLAADNAVLGICHERAEAVTADAARRSAAVARIGDNRSAIAFIGSPGSASTIGDHAALSME
jgi:hypothetical protein